MEDYKTGHRERLRARAEDTSLDSMRSHEILELILCYAVPRVDMNETARILIRRFGSLKNVLNASPEELMAVHGVGRSVVEWLGMVRELVEAYAAIDPADHRQIIRHMDAIDYVLSFRDSIIPPGSVVIYTDFNKRILMKNVICDSLSWAQPEYVRRILTEAISLQAKHVIIALFPGTLPLEYDEYDLNNLLNLARSLKAIHVELLDCIMVGESGVKSLNALEVMNIIRNESGNMTLHEEYMMEGCSSPSSIE